MNVYVVESVIFEWLDVNNKCVGYNQGLWSDGPGVSITEMGGSAT